MRIQHSRGAYEVQFAALAELAQVLPGGMIVLTDEEVWEAQGQRFPDVPRRIVVPSGEASKSLSSYADCQERLAALGVSRSDTLVAFGGGVVGDLAGFVAATYMRGIAWIQVPTTVMAMVDSSVGGKTAIDLEAGKNLVGAFHQPGAVYICTEVLETLPERHVRNGMAEVVKYKFIADPGLQVGLPAGTAEWEPLIARCLEIKAAVVEADEFETTGLRATLNFGHTVGHAIETALGYQSLLHGEAVAVGMVAEARLGERLGITPLGVSDALRSDLTALSLPTELPHSIGSGQLVEAMRKDKKRAGTGLSFALLEQIGACKLVHDVPESAILEAMKPL